jgi:uncharacterized protein YbcV (DUF1398 family)
MPPNLVETVQQAQRRGAAARPRVNGFPYYAEALRAAGITAVETSVATGGSIYHLADGAVAQASDPIAGSVSAVPDWDEGALIAAIRADQAGQTTFADFLAGSWKAGVIRLPRRPRRPHLHLLRRHRPPLRRGLPRRSAQLSGPDPHHPSHRLTASHLLQE